MTALWVVRHGEPEAGFGDKPDPGLSEQGLEQAAALAARLGDEPRRPVFSSPMLRARQTAEPLAATWGVSVAVAPVITEVSAPTSDLVERASWLRRVLADRWSSVDGEVAAWREGVIAAARGVKFPQVWFSHFVVINVLIGHARHDDQVTMATPSHAAVLEIDVGADGSLSIVAMPHEGDSTVG